jgi:hypothetical protein
MKIIQLTRGYETVVDDADYDRVIQAGPWHALVCRNLVYAMRKIRTAHGKETSLMLHRFILGITNRKVLVDHRDHSGLNNRRANLRVATKSQNGGNRRKNKGCTSRFKGVSYHTKSRKWHAQIYVRGKGINLGYFANEIDAAVAYYRAALEHFGEFHSTAGVNR